MTTYRIVSYGKNWRKEFIIQKKIFVFWVTLIRQPFTFQSIDEARRYIDYLAEQEKIRREAREESGKIMKIVRK